ncbi:MAG: hypothetical protein OXJ52_06890 [Oligoflexia bacterium]|nr:hypothetical protein [Oligoflexia bacterium]
MQGLLIDALGEPNRPIKQDIRTLKESLLSLAEDEKTFKSN